MSAGSVWHRTPGGARLLLLPQRAAFCPDTATLLVADAHLGKAHSFRRLGVPVPAGTTAEALARLDAMLAATGARHIAFLGDLLHSARAQSALAAVIAWRQRQPQLALTLVRGNHDRHAGDPPAALGVRAVDAPLRLGPWRLLHEPAGPAGGAVHGPDDGGYALAGHVHPGVALSGRARDRLRLPCFHFGPRQGVLPAFGGFTGLHVLPRAVGDAVYAVLPADPGVPGPPGGGRVLATLPR